MALDGRLLYCGPGEIVLDPTNLGAASPYGGTVLGGSVRDAALFIDQATARRLTEEYGPREQVEAVDVGRGWRLFAEFRGVSDDVLELVFPATFAGAVTGRPVVTDGALARAGRRGSERARTIFFAAESPTHQRSILLPAAVPILREITRLGLDQDTELVVGVEFRSLRGGDDDVPGYWGFLADLVSLL